MDYKDLSAKVHGLVKGQFGVNIVANIPLRGDRIKAAFRPIYGGGKVRKVTLVTDARMVRYEGMVNGKSEEKFTSEKLRGAEWIDYPYFKQSKSGIMLSFPYRPCDKTEFKSFYLINGRLATPTEEKSIKDAMYATNSYSKRQAEVGVSEEEQTSVVNYIVEGVVYFGTEKETAKQVWESLKG